MQDRPIMEWRGFQFFTDHFVHAKEEVRYGQVTALGYFRLHTERHLNLVRIGTDYLALVDIHLDDGRRLPVLFDNRQFCVGSKDDERHEANQVSAIYEHLAPRTFKGRLDKYLTQLNRDGYFTYDSKRFYADGTVRLEGEVVNIRHKRVRRVPFAVRIELPPASSGWQRLKDLLWHFPGITIMASIDEDCFLALLKELYGITFPKSNLES